MPLPVWNTAFDELYAPGDHTGPAWLQGSFQNTGPGERLALGGSVHS